MANVNVKFNNKDYLLSCDDGQEESLKKLTNFLDKKYTELKDNEFSLSISWFKFCSFFSKLFIKIYTIILI